MTRKPLRQLGGLAAVSAVLAVGAAGCAVSQQVGDAALLPMRVLLRKPRPVRIGITRVHINPLAEAPWEPLEKSLARKLGRDVQVSAYTPFQMRSQLKRGYLDFAILSATDYIEIGAADCCQLLAQPVNSLGARTRRGLILAKRDSKIRDLTDLKGQRFAFGPSWDAASHLAPAYAFLQAGLEPSDIARELAPVPLARRHHLDSLEVGKAVAYEPLMPAGAVDEVEYALWPDKGGSLLLQTISKDEFRVIGKTIELPEGPIVASCRADPRLVATVKDYLLSEAVPDKALKAMRWQKLVPVEAGQYDTMIEVVRQLHQAGWVREDMPQALAGEPASTEPAANGPQ